MSSSTAVNDSARRSLTCSPRRRLLATLPILVAAVVSCRADSLVTPGDQDCTVTASCAAPPDAAVIGQAGTSLQDVRGRVLVGFADGSIRARLTPALDGLAEAIDTDRLMQARMRLAEVYDLLDQLEGTAPEGTVHPDAAEFAAVRLSLVPVAGMLGVTVR